MPQIFGLDALDGARGGRSRGARHRARHGGHPDLSPPPDDAGGPGRHDAERDQRTARARHRAVAPDRGRGDVGPVLRQAGAAHARVPVDPAPAAVRRARVVPGRVVLDQRLTHRRDRPWRAADPRGRAGHADAERHRSPRRRHDHVDDRSVDAGRAHGADAAVGRGRRRTSRSRAGRRRTSGVRDR